MKIEVRGGEKRNTRSTYSIEHVEGGYKVSQRPEGLAPERSIQIPEDRVGELLGSLEEKTAEWYEIQAGNHVIELPESRRERFGKHLENVREKAKTRPHFTVLF